MSKLEQMKAGATVVTNDAELDALEAELDATPDGDRMWIRSLPNPQRCGLKDTYIAWINARAAVRNA